MGNQKLELERMGDRKWTTINSRYVPCFLTIQAYWRLSVCRDFFQTPEASEMLVNIQRKSGSLSSAKVNQVIDLEELFKDYWSSNRRQFTGQSQS